MNEHYGNWYVEYGGNSGGLPNTSMGTYILDAVFGVCIVIWLGRKYIH